MRKILYTLLYGLFPLFLTAQVDTVRVYGPGGPSPAIEEAAGIFTRQSGIAVVVTKGPLSKWQSSAEADADIIFSGSEQMMTHFMGVFPDLDPSTVLPLYLRPSGVLVRPGNPKGIRSLSDLLEPGVQIMVVQGAGLSGLWEDVVGRTGSIDTLKLFRRNVVHYAPDSGKAKERWQQDPQIDAWITWNIWQIAHKELADFVLLAPHLTLYRDCGVALTQRGKSNTRSQAFYRFLQTDTVRGVFEKWGWITR